MRYQPIEANNEILLSLISEEVETRKRFIELNYPEMTEQKKEELIKLYRKYLIDDALVRLNEEEYYMAFKHEEVCYKSHPESPEYDDDGRRGTQMSTLHISRVIIKNEGEAWYGACNEVLEYSESRNSSDVMVELESEFRRTIKVNLGKISGMTEDYEKEYTEKLVFAFGHWKRKREQYEPKRIKALYNREVELHLPYQYGRIESHIKAGGYTRFFIGFDV